MADQCAVLFSPGFEYTSAVRLDEDRQLGRLADANIELLLFIHLSNIGYPRGILRLRFGREESRRNSRRRGRRRLRLEGSSDSSPRDFSWCAAELSVRTRAKLRRVRLIAAPYIAHETEERKQGRDGQQQAGAA